MTSAPVKMEYVADDRGRGGRFVPATLPALPAPNVLLNCATRFAELSDGRCQLLDESGAGLGLFASRALAERTARFLAQ